MPSRLGSTDRSAVRVGSGACGRLGRWDGKTSRVGRACRATDRSIEIEVVQDPGGRRERPSVSREPPERSGRTTPHLRHVPGGAFHVSPSECDATRTQSSTPSASTRMKPLIENRWSGKNKQYSNTVERRRPAWHGAMSRGLTRLPLLGAPAARRAAGAPQLPGRPPARARCRTHLVQEGRIPGNRSICRRSSADREHLASNEGVGSSNLSDGVTVRAIRGLCKRIGTRGCGPLRAGSRPAPLTRDVPSAPIRRRIGRAIRIKCRNRSARQEVS